MAKWIEWMSTMSAVHFPLATYVKETLSQSTKTAGEMITPA